MNNNKKVNNIVMKTVEQIKSSTSNIKFYWSKRDQLSLEEGRQKVILDRLHYFSTSYEGRRVIIEKINDICANSSYLQTSNSRQILLVDAIRKHLLKDVVQKEMELELEFNNFIKEGKGDIFKITEEVIARYTEKAVLVIEKEARVFLRQEIHDHIEINHIQDIITKELERRPITFVDDRQTSINLVISFLENLKTQDYILDCVMGCYSLGDDIKAEKEYSISIKKAIKDRIVYYTENVLVKIGCVEYLQ